MSFQKVDYEDHITVITASNLNAIQTQVLQNASDISTHAESTVRHVTQQEKDGWTAKYTKDASGIPKEHLTSTVQESLSKADSAYQKPQTNIPKTDLESTVQATLDYSDYLNVLFPIKLTSDQQGQGTYTANKTFAQIQDAYNAGKKPFAFMPRGQILPLVNRSNNVSYTFCGVDADSNVKMTVVIGAGDIITYTGGSYLVDYVYLITVTDDTPPTFDKTFSDIYSELTEGTKAVILRDYEKGYTYQVYSVSSSSIKFLRFSGDDWLEGYQISSNGTVGPYQHDYPLLNEKEDKDNKVTLITAQSTNAQYPSAKCVYDSLALKSNQTSLDLTDRRVDALFKVNEGQTFDFDVDTATCYSATVPSGAVADSITKIGGKSVVMNQLVDSLTTSVTLTNNHKYLTDISGTESIQTGSGSSVSVTGGTDMVIDLTKMFGSGNEPTTVSQVKAMLPNDYYDYSAGEIVHAPVQNVDFAGRNLFNQETKLPEFGWVKQSDGSWYVANARTPYNKVIYENNDAYTGRIAIHLSLKFDSGASRAGAIPIVYYTDGTTGDISAGSSAYGSFVEVDFLTSPNKTVEKIIFVYGTGSTQTWIKEITICKSSTNVGYIQYTKKTVTIPSAIKSLTGYGWSAGSVCNEVDYANKKYIQRVARVDLGSYTWSYYGSSIAYISIDSSFASKTHNNMIAGKYGKANHVSIAVMEDKSIATNSGNENTIWFKDTSIGENGTSWKNAMSGVYLYYELATPIETDISSYLDEGFLEAISVEGGGSVTFVSDTDDDYRLPIPNTNEFVVKLSQS